MPEMVQNSNQRPVQVKIFAAIFYIQIVLGVLVSIFENASASKGRIELSTLIGAIIGLIAFGWPIYSFFYGKKWAHITFTVWTAWSMIKAIHRIVILSAVPSIDLSNRAAAISIVVATLAFAILQLILLFAKPTYDFFSLKISRLKLALIIFPLVGAMKIGGYVLVKETCDKWSATQNRCISKDCARTQSCQASASNFRNCAFLKQGMPADEVFYHLGMPLKVDRTTYFFECAKGDEHQISVVVSGGYLNTFDCSCSDK